MVQEFLNCTALAINTITGQWFAGTISHTRGRICVLALRGDIESRGETDLRVVFRTETGHAVADCQVVNAEDRTVEMILSGEIVNYHARCKERRIETQVSATCQLEGESFVIVLLDMSGSGLRFECERPLPIGEELAARIGLGAKTVDSVLTVQRLDLEEKGRYTYGALWTPQSRVEAGKLKRLITKSQYLDGSLVCGVQIGGNLTFAGFVNELDESKCSVTLRGQVALPVGTVFRLVCRTPTGQSSVEARVVDVNAERATFVLMSQFDHYCGRSSPRKRVDHVFAGCKVDGEPSRVRVVDLPETGFRYVSDRPLPLKKDFEILFSFNGVRIMSQCQIVRQTIQPDGTYTGGAKFRPQSRVELAKLIDRVRNAA